MPFTTPTLKELIARIEQDLAQRLGVSQPQIRRTNAAVLARVEAMGAFTLVEYMEWISRQIIYDTAEAEILARWATIWGIDRLGATAATGNVAIGGTDGTVIPAGTELQRTDGLQFTTDAEATIAGGTVAIAVTASLPGADGNTDEDEPLDLVSPIAGADSQAIVASGGLAGGTDQETDEALRARLLARVQQPPHGGASFDYVTWTLETEGVTVARRGPNPGDELVWVYALELGLGTVTVRFMADDGAGGMRVPTTQELDAVQAYIDTVRPVTADVYVVAPVATPIDFEISLTPNSSSVQAAVQAELADLLLREAEPGGTILLSHIQEAISIAAGETDHTLITPSADVVFSTGQIATLGNFTWS